jgi:hypothetical protein
MSFVLTAPASSFQNAPGEPPHQDIGASLQVILRGANLENKCWPFAFNYALQIINDLPHGDRGVSFERFTAQRGSVKKYRTFGCLVIVKPPDKRNGKLESNFRRGFFLGFTGTLLQIYYWDLGSREPPPLNLMNLALPWIAPLLTRENCVTPLTARICPLMSKNLVPLLYLTWPPRAPSIPPCNPNQRVPVVHAIVNALPATNRADLDMSRHHSPTPMGLTPGNLSIANSLPTHITL